MYKGGAHNSFKFTTPGCTIVAVTERHVPWQKGRLDTWHVSVGEFHATGSVQPQSAAARPWKKDIESIRWKCNLSIIIVLESPHMKRHTYALSSSAAAAVDRQEEKRWGHNHHDWILHFASKPNPGWLFNGSHTSVLPCIVLPYGLLPYDAIGNVTRLASIRNSHVQDVMTLVLIFLPCYHLIYSSYPLLRLLVSVLRCDLYGLSDPRGGERNGKRREEAAKDDEWTRRHLSHWARKETVSHSGVLRRLRLATVMGSSCRVWVAWSGFSHVVTEAYNDGMIIYHPIVPPMGTAAPMAVIGRVNFERSTNLTCDLL